MANTSEGKDATAAPKKPSLDERIARTKSCIQSYSATQSAGNTAYITAYLVVGMTLTEWQFSPDGDSAMFQPLNREEVQARLNNDKRLVRRCDRKSTTEEFEEKNAGRFREIQANLHRNFAIMRSGELQLSDDKKMVFENVMIDLNRDQVVGGTLRVVKKNGAQYTSATDDGTIEGQKPDNVLALQFTDRQEDSRACDYPQYDFDGQNLNNQITTDGCQAMAMLAEKWKEAMLLYLQATLDLREKQKAQREQETKQITEDAKKKLIDIGLAEF